MTTDEAHKAWQRDENESMRLLDEEEIADRDAAVAAEDSARARYKAERSWRGFMSLRSFGKG